MGKLRVSAPRSTYLCTYVPRYLCRYCMYKGWSIYYYLLLTFIRTLNTNCYLYLDGFIPGELATMPAIADIEWRPRQIVEAKQMISTATWKSWYISHLSIHDYKRLFTYDSSWWWGIWGQQTDQLCKSQRDLEEISRAPSSSGCRLARWGVIWSHMAHITGYISRTHPDRCAPSSCIMHHDNDRLGSVRHGPVGFSAPVGLWIIVWPRITKDTAPTMKRNTVNKDGWTEWRLRPRYFYHIIWRSINSSTCVHHTGPLLCHCLSEVRGALEDWPTHTRTN